MIKIYARLKAIAESKYRDIVASTKILSKRSSGSAKLRIFLKDKTYLRYMAKFKWQVLIPLGTTRTTRDNLSA
jgi:hypothetical protein